MTDHLIVFDTNLKRPGCAIIQAAGGGDPELVKNHFPSETWLNHWTPGMGIYKVSDEQLPQLVEIVCRQKLHE